MKDLVEFITSFDPEFPSRIEGATPEEIERFERAAGGPFPPDYRAFLEAMGRRDDALIVSDDVGTDADRLAEFYAEFVDTGEVTVPPDSIPFAISGLSIEELFLERTPPHRVLQNGDDGESVLWAASFRGFLFQQAFRRSLEFDAHSRAMFSNDASPRIARAKEILEDLGLERLWFSDEVTLCYASAEDKVIVHHIAGRNASVYFSCSRLPRAWRLGFRFARALKLPWWAQPF